MKKPSNRLKLTSTTVRTLSDAQLVAADGAGGTALTQSCGGTCVRNLCANTGNCPG